MLEKMVKKQIFLKNKELEKMHLLINNNILQIKIQVLKFI